MITEARFAASHHGFWHELLPMGESYIRNCNAGLARFARPLAGSSPARVRGIVNELGFRLFALCIRENYEPSSVPLDVVVTEAERARNFIASFRQHGRAPLPQLDGDGLREGLALASRTKAFFNRAAPADGSLLVEPSFPGCGWLSGCQGDALWATTIYEIKAGERAFRSTDVRQVFIYCALGFASKLYELDRVCLVNPRHGVYFSESLNDLCAALAGRSPTEVLSDIVEYISTATGDHDHG